MIEQPNVLPRLNTRLIGAPTTVLSFAPTQKAIFDVDLLRYLTKAEDAQESTLFMNVWLVGDFGTAVGRQLLSTGLKALKKSSQMRLAFIHNGGGNGEALSTTPNLLLVLLDKLPTTLAKQAINKLASMNDTAMEDLLRTGAMERLISGGQVKIS